jgi:hypothetical protein
MEPQEIAMKVRSDAEAAGKANPVPHPVMRFALAVSLPGIGMGQGAGLHPSGPEGHYTYTLPLPEPEPEWGHTEILKTWSEWWMAINRSLSEPVVNPARR